MSPEPMRGRCLCGVIQYTIDPPIRSAAHCHCESCRRAGGAAFITWMTVPSAKLQVSSGADHLSSYPSSPGAHRSFCGRCGSPLIMRYDAEPEWAWVTMASLTTPPEKGPSRHYSYEERVRWFSFHDALPKLLGKSEEPAE